MGAVPAWVREFANGLALPLDTDPDGGWGFGSAVFSPDRAHRYLLTRVWDTASPAAVFVMLNPSTADAFVFDPTVRRCAGFATSWGAGGLVVANIFALRATDPRELYRHPDPVGTWNDEALKRLPVNEGPVVAAWGVHGAFGSRGSVVARMLTGSGHETVALGVTKGGFPRHPLYVAGSTVPSPYSPADTHS